MHINNQMKHHDLLSEQSHLDSLLSHGWYSVRESISYIGKDLVDSGRVEVTYKVLQLHKSQTIITALRTISATGATSIV